MNFLVENGSGNYNANALAGLGFVQQYLRVRGLAVSWDVATVASQKEWIIEATDYLENRWGNRFQGKKAITNIVVSAYNFLNLLAQPSNLDTFTIGAITYRFTTTVSTAYDITIGVSLAATVSNVISAINLTGTNDLEYATGTLINADVSVDSFSESSIRITSRLVGELGNESAVCSSATVNFDFDNLYNGLNVAEQNLSFPRLYLYSSTGIPVTGVPLKIKKAIAELAYRAQTGSLMADPVIDSTGMQVTKTFDKVGPIEQEREYVGGSGQSLFKKFPIVENLVKEFIIGGQGGVTR